MKVHRTQLLTLAVIVILGGNIQLWAASQWRTNFDSDEAIMGLMALHTLRGEIPTYFYGQHYAGSLEALLSAVVLRVLGHGVFPLRVICILIYTALLVISYFWAKSMFDTRLALLNTLLLAIPSWMVLFWTYRPLESFGILLATGPAIFWLSELKTKHRILRPARLIGIGLLFGLGFWLNPMIIIYVFTLCLTRGLRMPEWASARNALDRLSARVVGISFDEMAPVAVIGLAGIGTLAFFSQGCTPASLYDPAAWKSRLLLAAIFVALVLVIALVSRRRRSLAASLLLVGLGFTLGNVPQWKAWLFHGTSPTATPSPSCPVDSITRAKLLGEELIPTLWGAPDNLPDIASWSPVQITLSSFSLLVMTAALLTFVWKNRIALWSLVSLRVPGQEQTRAQVVALWFAVPIGLVLLSSNTVDRWSSRYLLVSWQASTTILAWFLDGLIRRNRRYVAAALLGIWILYMAVVGYGNLYEEWHGAPYSSTDVTELESFLRSQNVQGGYADYWLAYTADYLTAERLVFVPFSGPNRYTPYASEVDSLATQAFVLPAYALPEEATDINDLAAYIGNLRSQSGFPELSNRLTHQAVVRRTHVATWDVWLVTNE